VILSGLLKRNQQTKKQSEMEKEGDGHRASEIEDKAVDESPGQSRVRMKQQQLVQSSRRRGRP